ncbi:MAG: hypothetical protein WC984_01395 [Bacteroidales bacterium]
MKTNILLILFSCFGLLTNAQNIDKLISQTEKLLSQHENISYLSEGISTKDFDFTEEELKDEEGNTNFEDGIIDPYFAREIIQKRILTNINKIAYHKDFPKKGRGLFISSPDNKVFNFVMDENTGGTYRSRISVMYYKVDGKILFQESGIEQNTQNIFNIDGYAYIDSIQSDTCVKYIFQGSVIGCGTCLGEYIKLMHFSSGVPIIDFEYSLSTRIGSVKQFDYNSKDKTITIEYEEDDLNGEYNYENECGDYHFKKYKFNGATFEPIEKRWVKCNKSSEKE